jgi:hypothetical protein
MKVMSDPIGCVSDVRKFFSNRKIIEECIEKHADKMYNKGFDAGHSPVKKYGINIASQTCAQ